MMKGPGPPKKRSVDDTRLRFLLVTRSSSRTTDARWRSSGNIAIVAAANPPSRYRSERTKRWLVAIDVSGVAGADGVCAHAGIARHQITSVADQRRATETFIQPECTRRRGARRGPRTFVPMPGATLRDSGTGTCH